MDKIIVAIDSFKGSLTSEEAGLAVKEGLQETLPGYEIICLPISDGGEGILSVLLHLSKGTYRSIHVTGPCGESMVSCYGISGTDSQTAFIELASAAGLPLVTPKKRNPMQTTTYGVGELMMAALREGRKHIVIGIGGSATNDAGTGLLTALGYRFLNKDGQELPGIGASLKKIASVDASNVSPLLKDAEIEVACDVNNPFFGPLGAARVFAPQKGATPEMVDKLDEGLSSFSRVITQATGTDISNMEGAGAAGGVGGALAAFLHARLSPGIDLILDALHFDRLLNDANLVITGEGHADRQSVMGKVVSGILKRTKAHRKPLILFCGGFDDAKQLNEAGITSVFSIVPSPVSLQTAMQTAFARENLKRLAIQVGRLIDMNN